MLKFTRSHEWIEIDGDVGTVGITDYAQKELGEVVYVELPAVGKKIQAGEEVAILESTKAAADIYAPVSGEVVEINQKLGDFAPQINQSAEKEGWLFKVRLRDPAELHPLLDKTAYGEMIS